MANKNGWLRVIRAELARHPKMDERDLLKLAYHAVFGGDHLLVDPSRYGEGVRAEWDRLASEDPRFPGEILQPIDPEGRTARIHLAACKALDIHREQLIELLAGQGKKLGVQADYERRWGDTVELARSGEIPFSTETLVRIGRRTGTPHHGPQYGFASYRIVNDLLDPEMAEGLRRLGVVR